MTCASRVCPPCSAKRSSCVSLDKTSVLLGLNKLGFTPEVQAKLEEIVAQPNGMFLTTGPTGSGKTTTLYSVLHKINSVEKTSSPLKTRCEYQLSGVSQVQINKKGGSDVPDGPALVPAARPGHHHGRRDARPGNGFRSPLKRR